MDIKTIVDDFARRLSAIIDQQATERARATVLAAFGGPPRRGPGRPPKAAADATTPAAKKSRKKPPRQLCPVPGCTNPAAPVFGMVCAKHKDLPKAKIQKYREARRATKLGLKPVKVTKRHATKRAAPKATAGTTPTVAAATTA
jgi:hypothetical protein